ncbi:MAG TPA: SusC/RagA family TonB-linked outer membrane protein, partial [Porphyromonadaceae bacterium]|nr:SusC/RagA family TonB-linked outer membrane protein [Porphyromonadaceae bacterium]
MKKQKIIFYKGMLLLFVWAVSLCSFAQNITLRGNVSDTKGDPLVGVTVQAEGSTAGTVTDADGNFTLPNVPGNATLVVSYMGMRTQTIELNGRTTLNVVLEEDAELLDEVVVVGYGTQTRREITGSIANVSEENFNKGINRDASDLLQGKVAGLIVTSGSGDVTRGSQIRLRGTSTLQNDQGPMIVIDGIPGGDMSTVSPSDIESISVLKDASSAAIYGSRAAGGVILITTKRGSGAKNLLQYDGYVSVDQVANKPDMMNAAEWRATNKELGNDISNFDGYTADTDWFGEMLRTGISTNHSISLSGGGPKHNYRASYTFLDRTGIARDNEMTRHSFRFQLQQRAINDRLRVGLTGSGTLTDMRFPFRDDFILAYNMPPVYPVYNEDGSYFTAANNAYDQGNPVQNQDQNYRKASNNYFYGAGDLQFDIVEGLNLKASLYKSRFSSDYSEWEDPRNSRGDGNNGLAVRQARKWDRELMEWTANYETTFGADKTHKFDAILGYSWENNVFSSQRSQATDFVVNSMGADNIQSGNSLKIG